MTDKETTQNEEIKPLCECDSVDQLKHHVVDHVNDLQLHAEETEKVIALIEEVIDVANDLFEESLEKFKENYKEETCDKLSYKLQQTLDKFFA